MFGSIRKAMVSKWLNILIISCLFHNSYAKSSNVMKKWNTGNQECIMKQRSTFVPKKHASLMKSKSDNCPKQVNTLYTEKRGGNLLSGNTMFTSQSLWGATFFIVFDVALREAFKQYDIAFPSMVAGCLLLFVLLLIAETLKSGLGDGLFQALTPGSTLLAQWLPVFFVPGLALLPLAPKFGSALEGVKVLSVVVIGFYFSLYSIAYSVLSLRQYQGNLVSVASEKATTTTTSSSPPKVFSDMCYQNVGYSSLVFGILSILLIQMTPGNRWITPIQTIFMSSVTIASYIFGTRLPKSITAFFHPLVTSTVITLLTTKVFGMITSNDFINVLQTYKSGSLSLWKGGAGDFLLFLLGPSVVSMSIAMYSRKALMKENWLVVLVSTSVSAGGGLFGTAIFVKWLRMANDILRISLLPRNITTGLAIAITNIMGGNVAITASVVVMTGIFGATFGTQILNASGIHDPVSRGLAIGGSAQGLGVASLVNEKDAFPFAAIGLVLNAVFATTLASIPPVKEFLLQLALDK